MKPSDTIRGILLSGAGILLALALVELPALLHLVDYRNVTWLSSDRFDPELLTMHRPHAQFHGSALGGALATAYKIPRSEMSLYRWNVKYDAHGFRNDTDLDRADVVVVGASFVEAMPVSSDALMTTLLARQTGTVVANLGQQDFSPTQDLIVLQRYGLPLRPRTVIWMFTDFNDLRQALYYRYAAPDPPGFWPAFFRRSFTRFAYRQLQPYLKSAPKGDGASRSGVVRNAQGNMIRIYFLHPLLPLSAESLSALEDTRAVLANAYALGAAQGARLLVVFVPEPFRVFQPFASFPVNSECRQWILNDEPQRLEAAVRSISPAIGYLDLTPVLREAVGKGIVPYFTDDNHWSPVGHQIAARAIAEYLTHTPPDSPRHSQF